VTAVNLIVATVTGRIHEKTGVHWWMVVTAVTWLVLAFGVLVGFLVVGAVAAISIDTTSPVPPYEQIRSQFAALITNRALPVGAKLPTVRALAADLGLAVNTVARSYRELEEAGLVETRGRAGTFVSAAGERSRTAVHQAARDYALKARALGLAPEEALSIVRAAILTIGTTR
jgi:DNA-binding transcriptional regulator YhcF (GntR family)